MSNLRITLICLAACVGAGLSAYFGQSIARDHTIVQQTVLTQQLMAANQQCGAQVAQYEAAIKSFNERQALAQKQPAAP